MQEADVINQSLTIKQLGQLINNHPNNYSTLLSYDLWKYYCNTHFNIRPTLGQNPAQFYNGELQFQKGIALLEAGYKLQAHNFFSKAIELNNYHALEHVVKENISQGKYKEALDYALCTAGHYFISGYLLAIKVLYEKEKAREKLESSIEKANIIQALIYHRVAIHLRTIPELELELKNFEPAISENELRELVYNYGLKIGFTGNDEDYVKKEGDKILDDSFKKIAALQESIVHAFSNLKMR